MRVFTFSVGQHNYDVTPLQWMACANKGERSWHPAGMGGCGVLGSPLAQGLAPVLQCTPLLARPWLQARRAGQQDSQTAGQADSRLSSCLSLSFPRLLLRNPLHRCHPHQHAGMAGCRQAGCRQAGSATCLAAAGRAALPGVLCLGVCSGSPSPGAVSPKAGSKTGSRAEPSARPRATEISNSSSAAPHGPAVF